MEHYNKYDMMYNLDNDNEYYMNLLFSSHISFKYIFVEDHRREENPEN